MIFGRECEHKVWIARKAAEEEMLKQVLKFAETFPNKKRLGVIEFPTNYGIIDSNMVFGQYNDASGNESPFFGIVKNQLVHSHYVGYSYGCYFAERNTHLLVFEIKDNSILHRIRQKIMDTNLVKEITTVSELDTRSLFSLQSKKRWVLNQKETSEIYWKLCNDPWPIDRKYNTRLQSLLNF